MPSIKKKKQAMPANTSMKRVSPDIALNLFSRLERAVFVPVIFHIIRMMLTTRITNPIKHNAPMTEIMVSCALSDCVYFFSQSGKILMGKQCASL
jgi:hypothetical protein